MYLLDTNIISYLLKGDKNVSARVVSKQQDELCLCSIVVAELFFGALKHPSRSQELTKIYTQTIKEVICFDFDLQAALIFAKLEHELSTTGKIIDDMDLQIASICLANDLVLVTNNTKHFDQIPGLTLENWSE